MVQEQENNIIPYFRKLDERLGRIENKMQDVYHRLASIETKLSHMQNDDVQQLHRIDRLGEDIDMIKRRLDLYDPTH